MLPITDDRSAKSTRGAALHERIILIGFWLAISTAGAWIITAYWLKHGQLWADAVPRATLFVIVMTGVHLFGYSLFKNQSKRSDGAVLPPADAPAVAPAGHAKRAVLWSWAMMSIF